MGRPRIEHVLSIMWDIDCFAFRTNAITWYCPGRCGCRGFSSLARIFHLCFLIAYDDVYVSPERFPNISRLSPECLLHISRGVSRLSPECPPRGGPFVLSSTLWKISIVNIHFRLINVFVFPHAGSLVETIYIKGRTYGTPEYRQTYYFIIGGLSAYAELTYILGHMYTCMRALGAFWYFLYVLLILLASDCIFDKAPTVYCFIYTHI